MAIEPRSPDILGRMILNRYRVVRRLASGGMGSVYLARSEGAAGFVRPVALKRILPQLNDPAYGRLFVREAQILSTLRHPGLVSIVDFQEEDGAYYMALEYVHGYDASRWRRYRSLVAQAIPLELALYLVLEVLDALSYAHTLSRPSGEFSGIVHRDVTTSNVLLDLDGRVRLTDFGIARREVQVTSDRTELGKIRGKLHYLAPELLRGSPPTPNSDVYSSALLLYELLAGGNPFRFADPGQTVRAVVEVVPEPIARVRTEVPAALSAVLERALNKTEAQRFPSARAFAEALAPFAAQSREQARNILADVLGRDFSDPRMAKLAGGVSLEELDRCWREEPLPSTERSCAVRLASGSGELKRAEAAARSGQRTELDLAAGALSSRVSARPTFCPHCTAIYRSHATFCALDGHALEVFDQNPLLGQVVARYRLQRVLGEGATGFVYLAQHVELETEFALKVLSGDLSADETAASRFRREARTASRVHSPHVVPVVDCGRTERGLSYLVMEYVAGTPLDRFIRERAPLSTLDALALIEQIALGLAAIHALGFVHREVEPGHIFVVEQGPRTIARVSGFGAVRGLDGPLDLTRLTEGGLLFGNPLYMAPELWLGAPVGPSGDLYALGVILYELVTGRRPFEIEGITDAMAQHLHTPVPRDPALASLQPLLDQLLEKNAERRLGRAEDCAAACRTLAEQLRPHVEAERRALESDATIADLPQRGAPEALPMDLPMGGGASAVVPRDDAIARDPRRSRWVAGIVTACVLGAAAGWFVKEKAAVVELVPFRSLPQIRASLDQAIEARGMSPSDLPWLASHHPTLALWVKCEATQDVEMANRIEGELLAAVQLIPIDAGLLTHRLDALDARLADRLEQRSPAERARIEAQYQALYRQVRPGLGDREARVLLAKIDRFAAEL